MRAVILLLLMLPVASAAVEERALPPTWEGPSDVVFDGDGRLWVALSGSWALGRLDPVTMKGDKFPLAARPTQEADSLWSVRLAPDGSAWTGSQTHIHRVDATTGNASAFPLPVTTYLPGDIHVLPDGLVLFALIDAGVIVELDPATGLMTRHDAPAESGPLDFLNTEDGLLVTLTYANGVARFDPATGKFTVLATGVESPVGIAGTDAGVWVAEMGASRLSLIPAAGTASGLQRYPTTESPYYPVSGPSGILVAKDGSIWFAEHFADRVARLDARAGRLHEYEVPSSPGTNIQRLAEAPDGAIWVAEVSTHKLARVTFTNEPLPFALPDAVTMRIGTPMDVLIPSAGPLKVGSPDANLTVTEGPAKITLRASEGLAPGAYRVLVATTQGKTTVGGYLDVNVEASRGTPGPAPLLMLLVIVGAAFMRRWAPDSRRGYDIPRAPSSPGSSGRR